MTVAEQVGARLTALKRWHSGMRTTNGRIVEDYAGDGSATLDSGAYVDLAGEEPVLDDRGTFGALALDVLQVTGAFTLTQEDCVFPECYARGGFGLRAPSGGGSTPGEALGRLWLQVMT